MLCAEWFADRYGCNIVIVVRHPCAVAASDKMLGWSDHPKTYLKNPALVEKHLLAYMELIELADTHWARMGAVWGVRYRLIADFMVNHPDWRVIEYENLCLDPIEQFEDLYDYLGLSWNASVSEEIVKNTTTVANSCERQNTWHTSRMSTLQADRWRNELSDEEIEQVRRFQNPFENPRYRTRKDW